MQCKLKLNGWFSRLYSTLRCIQVMSLMIDRCSRIVITKRCWMILKSTRLSQVPYAKIVVFMYHMYDVTIVSLGDRSATLYRCNAKMTKARLKRDDVFKMLPSISSLSHESAQEANNMKRYV
mmetsp:Transcript_1448/g.2820  ORF Transcript_1448/g.2820 Transcript_1448/m.2820 type:complete len:122 (+) Transcript_1448:294-659(+)